MKKIIIGLIGYNNCGRKTASNIFKKYDFYSININSKVEEIAKYLFNEDELSSNKVQIVNETRRRGSKVNPNYWINLSLINVPCNKKYIVFEDLSIDELNNKSISAYQIYRPDVSLKKHDDIPTIVNDGSKVEFHTKIEELLKKLNIK